MFEVEKGMYVDGHERAHVIAYRQGSPLRTEKFEHFMHSSKVHEIDVAVWPAGER